MKNAEFFESRGRLGNQRTAVTSTAVAGKRRPARSRHLLQRGKISLASITFILYPVKSVN